MSPPIIHRDIPAPMLLEIEDHIRAGVARDVVCKRYRIGCEMFRRIKANTPRVPEKVDGRANRADDQGAYLPSAAEIEAATRHAPICPGCGASIPPGPGEGSCWECEGASE